MAKKMKREQKAIHIIVEMSRDAGILETIRLSKADP
jgi:hypothetical protein